MAVVNTILQMRDQMSRALRGPTEALRRMRQQAERANQSLRAMGRAVVRPVIALRDLATRQIQRLRTSLSRLGSIATTLRIAVRDFATQQLLRMRSRLSVLASATTTIGVKVRDMATNVIRAIQIKLFPLGGLPTIIRVTVRDAATTAIQKVRLALTRLGHMTSTVRVALRDAATTAIQKIRLGLTRLAHLTTTVRVYIKDAATRALSRIMTAARAIGHYVIMPVVKVVANTAMAALNRIRTGLVWLGHQTPTIGVFLRDAATAGLKAIGRIAQRLGALAVHVTVRVRDAATATLKGIQRVAKTTSGILSKVGALTGLSGGTILAQGTNSTKTDALIAAQTGQYGGNVTSAIDNIYYNYKAGGTDRETVAKLYSAVASQTNSTGSQLERQTALAARYQALDPEADPTEVARAFTASYNSGLGDFSQTGDALAYIRRNGGDQYKDLLDTFNEYATSANRAGVSTNQLASGLVSYQKAGGRNYDNPADAMREWGIRAVTTVDKNAVDALSELVGKKQTQQMYKELKKGFKEGRGSEAAFEFLTAQVEALNKLDNPMKRQILQAKLYGSQFEDNDKAMQSFFEGLIKGVDTTGELEKAYKQLKDSDPAAAMTESWLRFKKTTKDIGIGIVTALQPTFEELNAWLTSDEGKKGIQEFSDSLKELGKTVGKDLVDGFKWLVTHWDDIQAIFTGKIKNDKGDVIQEVPNAFQAIREDFHKLAEAADEVAKPLRAANDIMNLLSASSSSFSMSGVVGWFDQSLKASTPFYDMIRLTIDGLNALMNKNTEAQKSFSDTEAAVRRMGNAVTENSPVVNAIKTQTPQKSFTDTLAANNPNLYPKGIPTNQNKKSGFAAGMWKVPADMEVKVHEDEAILPAKDARKFRAMVAGDGTSMKSAVSSSDRPIAVKVSIGQINNNVDSDKFINRIGQKIKDATQIHSKGGVAIEGQ